MQHRYGKQQSRYIIELGVAKRAISKARRRMLTRIFVRILKERTGRGSGLPRAFGTWGERWELTPLSLSMSDWQMPKVLSLATGGSGAEPQMPMLLGVNGTHF